MAAAAKLQRSQFKFDRAKIHPGVSQPLVSNKSTTSVVGEEKTKQDIVAYIKLHKTVAEIIFHDV